MRRSTNKYPIIMDQNPFSPMSESYRTVRTSIDYYSKDKEMRVIAITSATPREGKTLTAINLSVAFAQTNRRVLLVDADLRKPSLHQAFNLHSHHGLSDLLVDHDLGLMEVVKNTDIPNLSVLTSGTASPYRADLLASKLLVKVFQEAKEHFDIIIVDTSPISFISESQVVAANSDGVLLVVQSGSVKRQSIKLAKESLDRVNASLIGIVMNQAKLGKNKIKVNSRYYNTIDHLTTTSKN